MHRDFIDERHFLIALAMLLFEGSPPAASALRYLTGLSQREDTSYGVRIDDHGNWIRDLAESHGTDRTMFPYDINAPRGRAAEEPRPLGWATHLAALSRGLTRPGREWQLFRDGARPAGAIARPLPRA